MNRIDCKHTIFTVYEEFYRQVTANYDYVLESRLKAGKNDVLVERFLDWLSKKYSSNNLRDGLLRVNKEWFIEYFKHQFSYWMWRIDKQKNFSKGYRNIQLAWIIGDAARERFDKQKNTRIFGKVREINRAHLNVQSRLNVYGKDNVKALSQTFFSGSNVAEEKEKERFYNKQEGLVWCVNFTTLYNEKSSLCVSCGNRTRCKEILKENYPKIYNTREKLNERV